MVACNRNNRQREEWSRLSSNRNHVGKIEMPKNAPSLNVQILLRYFIAKFDVIAFDVAQNALWPTENSQISSEAKVRFICSSHTDPKCFEDEIRIKNRHFYRLKKVAANVYSIFISPSYDSHTLTSIPNHNKLDFRFAWKNLFSYNIFFSTCKGSPSESILFLAVLIKDRTVDSERELLICCDDI